MAITKEFSLQNTTVEIFDNSTGGQQTALNTLRTSIKAATTDALRVAAYDVYFTAPVSKVIGGTGILATAPAQVDGYFAGTWTKSGQSGTFSSTGSIATGITANFFLSSGTPASINLDAADLTFTSGNSDKGTITVTSAVTSLLFAGFTRGTYSIKHLTVNFNLDNVKDVFAQQG